MTHRAWVTAPWAILGALLLVAAYLLINTTLMLYDDEGYVLITYQRFNAGGVLYSEIFSQYGPWPYLYHWLAGTLLRADISHDVGRALTMFHWVTAALGAGWIATRLCHDQRAGFATALATFGLLWQMSAEPGHPGGLIVLVLTLGTVAALASMQARRWIPFGLGLGVSGALLLLTKVNVGLLFLAGASCVLLHLTAWPAAAQRVAKLAGTAGLLATPWVLMGSRLGESWVLAFAAIATVAFASLLWLARGVRAVIPVSATFATGGSFFATFGLVVAFMVGRGIPPGALLQAVFIAPLQHPANFMVGLSWPPAIWLLAAVVAGLVALRAPDRTRGEAIEANTLLIVLIRLGAVAVFILGAATWPTLAGVSRFLMAGLPLVPVFLVPLHDAAAARQPVRLLVACLVVPQVLHAFPVAGSQMGWGSFLLVPLFAAGLHDAWLALAGRVESWRRHVPAIGWTTLLIVTLGQLGLLLWTGWERYRQSRPLELPGAADIRPGDGARLTVRVMTLNAAIHADRLFSYPGMYSYNLWSGVPTPTARNATHWFWLLGDEEQQAIIDVLRATPRSALVTNNSFDQYFEQQNVPVRGPLRPWIRENYRPLLRHGYFEFLVPRTSVAVPFGTTELLEPAAGASAEFPALLQTNVALQGRPTAFELREIIHPWRVQAAYTPPLARITLTPISSEGRVAGPPLTLPLGHDLRGLYRVDIYAPAKPPAARLPDLVLTGLDARGGILCESIF